jgi:hypothetical protein
MSSSRASVDTLLAAVWNDAPSGRSKPFPGVEPLPTSDGVCLILDITRLGLTRDRGRSVRIYAASPFEAGPRLSLATLGNELGIVCQGTGGRDGGFREQVICLARTRSFEAGERRWLSCPGLANAPCGRRAMKLYLPPGESVFACAECHGMRLGHERGSTLHWRGRLLRRCVLDWQDPWRTIASRPAPESIEAAGRLLQRPAS